MKRALFLALCLALMLAGGARAESAVERALEKTDLTGIEEYLSARGLEMDLGGLVDYARTGDATRLEAVWEGLKARLALPVERALRNCAALVAPLAMLALQGCLLPKGRGASKGARFALRAALVLAYLSGVGGALDVAGRCLEAASALADAVSPALAALLAAAGMGGAAALISPGAAMAANLVERLFGDCGLPLCRAALCAAAAGALAESLRLDKLSDFIRRAVNWGSGLAITLFTALIAVQSGVAASIDGVAVRTAKYAVDSAAPVIGSGVSGAWESYVAGVMIAKNALGVCGVGALLAASLAPIVEIVATMLILNLASLCMDVLGDAQAARGAGSMAGVCQILAALCAGAVAVLLILLGAAMALGRNLAA